jgi:hypothetical protein
VCASEDKRPHAVGKLPGRGCHDRGDAGGRDWRRAPVPGREASRRLPRLTPRVLQSGKTPARVRPPSRRPLGRVGFSVRAGSSRPRSGALTGSRPGGLVDPGGRGSCSAPADQPCPRRATGRGVARATPRGIDDLESHGWSVGFPLRPWSREPRLPKSPICVLPGAAGRGARRFRGPLGRRVGASVLPG